MEKKMQFDEFPIDELRMTKSIVKDIHISKYSLMEYDDLVGEVMLHVYSNKEVYMGIRERSYSSTLMWTSLRRIAWRIAQRDMRNSDLSRHSYDEVKAEIVYQLKRSDGELFAYYTNQPENIKKMIWEIFIEKKIVAHALNDNGVKQNQGNTIIRQLQNQARMKLSHETHLSFEELFHE